MDNEEFIKAEDPNPIQSSQDTSSVPQQILDDSTEDYIEILDEIKKNPVPFIGLIWKIIEKNNVDMNTLLLKDMETFKEEQQEILEKNSKNDYDFSNFQIPALTNYSNWSRLLMDFLFKTYNINATEQTKIMQGAEGYSDKELQDLILKRSNAQNAKSHKRNANNILCAGLTEILLLYFQNMEYTKTSTFEEKNKNKQVSSNLYIYDARLRQVLRQFLKDLLTEYKNISKKQFEKELSQKLENISFNEEEEEISEEVRLQKEMKLLKQASEDYIYEVQEDIDMEFSSIIPEVENRVSCLLWEQYQKALEEQKKKNGANNNGNSEEDPYLKNEKGSAKSKWMMWGLATVGSGILIGVTGGLAAPIVGAGLGTLGAGLSSLGAFLGITTAGVMTGIGTFLTTASGVAIFGALFGLTGGGLTAYNFHKAFSGLKEFKFIELPYKGTDPDINKFIEKKKKEESKKNKDSNSTSNSANNSASNSPITTIDNEFGRQKSMSFSQSSVSTTLSDSEATYVHNDNNTMNDTVVPIQNTPSKLHVIICISGWMKDIEDVYKPWESLISNRNTMSSNIYVLKFDSKILVNLGQAMESMLVSGSITFTVKQLLRQTILGGVVSGLIWPVAMVQMGTMIDNPWTSGLDKAEKAGKVLAREVLLKYVHGKRPVTLVGYSLGARVIYYCLLELWNYTFELNMKKRDESFLSWYKRRNDNSTNSDDQSAEEIEKAKYLCHSIVDSVYLFGSPVESDPLSWAKIRAMTAGRVINGYCQTDWVLSFLFRASAICNHIAGLQKVDVEGIENIDLTSIVSGHVEYKDKLEEILEYVGFEDGIIVTH